MGAEEKKLRVVAFGTFDLLHPGHLFYLSRAKKLGDYLVVVVARDSTVKKVKGHAPLHGEKQRLALVSSLKYVDKAILGCSHKKMFRCVSALKPDVIAMGYDQKPGNEKIMQELSRLGCFPRIVRLGPFMEHLHKSSKIKERIRRQK